MRSCGSEDEDIVWSLSALVAFDFKIHYALLGYSETCYFVESRRSKLKIKEIYIHSSLAN